MTDHPVLRRREGGGDSTSSSSWFAAMSPLDVTEDRLLGPIRHLHSNVELYLRAAASIEGCRQAMHQTGGDGDLDDRGMSIRVGRTSTKDGESRDVAGSYGCEYDNRDGQIHSHHQQAIAVGDPLACSFYYVRVSLMVHHIVHMLLNPLLVRITEPIISLSLNEFVDAWEKRREHPQTGDSPLWDSMDNICLAMLGTRRRRETRFVPTVWFPMWCALTARKAIGERIFTYVLLCAVAVVLALVPAIAGQAALESRASGVLCALAAVFTVVITLLLIIHDHHSSFSLPTALFEELTDSSWNTLDLHPLLLHKRRHTSVISNTTTSGEFGTTNRNGCRAGLGSGGGGDVGAVMWAAGGAAAQRRESPPQLPPPRPHQLPSLFVAAAQPPAAMAVAAATSNVPYGTHINNTTTSIGVFKVRSTTKGAVLSLICRMDGFAQLAPTIIVNDTSREVVSVSESALAQFGIARSKLVGQRSSNVFSIVTTPPPSSNNNDGGGGGGSNHFSSLDRDPLLMDCGVTPVELTLRVGRPHKTTFKGLQLPAHLAGHTQDGVYTAAQSQQNRFTIYMLADFLQPPVSSPKSSSTLINVSETDEKSSTFQNPSRAPSAVVSVASAPQIGLSAFALLQDLERLSDAFPAIGNEAKLLAEAIRLHVPQRPQDEGARDDADYGVMMETVRQPMPDTSSPPPAVLSNWDAISALAADVRRAAPHEHQQLWELPTLKVPRHEQGNATSTLASAGTPLVDTATLTAVLTTLYGVHVLLERHQATNADISSPRLSELAAAESIDSTYALCLRAEYDPVPPRLAAVVREALVGVDVCIEMGPEGVVVKIPRAAATALPPLARVSFPRLLDLSSQRTQSFDASSIGGGSPSFDAAAHHKGSTTSLAANLSLVDHDYKLSVLLAVDVAGGRSAFATLGALSEIMWERHHSVSVVHDLTSLLQTLRSSDCTVEFVMVDCALLHHTAGDINSVAETTQGIVSALMAASSANNIALYFFSAQPAKGVAGDAAAPSEMRMAAIPDCVPKAMHVTVPFSSTFADALVNRALIHLASRGALLSKSLRSRGKLQLTNNIGNTTTSDDTCTPSSFLLNFPYTLGEKLGSGAFGDVHAITIGILEGKAAVKRIFLGSGKDQKDSSRLALINREVNILSQLRHPNVVRFLCQLREEQWFCLFLERCERDSLAVRMRRGQRSPKGGKKPKALIADGSTISGGDDDSNNDAMSSLALVRVIRDVASGLAYIHSLGIVHRDIKPDNILFRDGQAKIADFGAASQKGRDIGGDNATSGTTTTTLTPRSGNMRGTLAYMAPEVLLGEPYHQSADVWSFGCVLAEILGLQLQHMTTMNMVTLTSMYQSMSSEDHLLVPDELGLPDHISDLLEQCLHRDIDRRPTSAAILDHPIVWDVESVEEARRASARAERSVGVMSFDLSLKSGLGSLAAGDASGN